MDDSQKIWRYISFSRFVWFLQKKSLWLARVDIFSDTWEVSLTQNQIEFLASRHPVSMWDSPNVETSFERAKRINALWRVDTYVNCWSGLDHESHALWRIFCGPSEGVAVQTTLGKLRTALDNIPVYPVLYGEPPDTTPQHIVQATIKRPVFSYEHELRIIAGRGTAHPNLKKGEFGFELPLDMNIIDCVAVHPEADDSFKETAMRTVGDYAPTLAGRVKWSSMKEKPPLRS